MCSRVCALDRNTDVTIIKIMTVMHFAYFMAKQTKVDPGLLITEASQSHSDATHSVGIFLVGDQIGGEAHT
jgi:hypothetical protein